MVSTTINAYIVYGNLRATYIGDLCDGLERVRTSSDVSSYTKRKHDFYSFVII